MIEIGKPAPDFALYNTEKQLVSLESLRGKNVLIHFFPMAFTSVCTAQLCNARDNMEVYTRLNCTVLGISVDSLFTLGQFKKQENYSFDLLSDFNKTTITDYGLFNPDFVFNMKGVSHRAAILMDKQGIVRYFEVTPTAGDQPNYLAIREALESL
ncbi:MAG: redoxin domain-containing protein [Candidatus Competibacteraceae bacterium]|nr:redoxin domain-containing protein [Candidatus Competibacteraceae bacterium]